MGARALAAAVTWVDALPGMSFDLRPVSGLWVLLCYGGMVLVVLSRRAPLARWAAAGAVALLAGATLWSQRAAPAPSVAELHLLAVGAGQCAVLRTPAGQSYLFDAGTQSGFDVASDVMLPFFRARRLPLPTRAFISHANTDHFNAVGPLLNTHRLRGVYLNDYFGVEKDHPGGPASGKLLRSLLACGADIIRLRTGQSVRLDERTSVEVLWPPAGHAHLRPNDRSLVLRITCDDRSVLLTGDLQEAGQLAICALGAGAAADALVLPHHGSWKATLPQFVQTVSPEVVLLSGAHEPQHLPRQDERRRFYESLPEKYRYYSTHRNGWIRLRFGAGGLVVQTMRR